MDENNIFKGPVRQVDIYGIYIIYLILQELMIVRDAIIILKKEHEADLLSNRSGHHIAFICKEFIKNEKAKEL